MKKTLLAALPLALLLGACATRPVAPLPTVAAVDLKRYAGTWHEVALLPNRFQAMCASDTQAHYRLDGDVVRVTNRCRTEKGEVTQADGIAKVVEGSNNAKLRVSFFRPFWGDYWIVDLGADYEYAVVGHPGRDYLWILGRAPTMPEATYEGILARLRDKSYDTSRLKRTRH